MTARLATRIPFHHRSTTLAFIKAIHTVVFVSIAGLIVLFATDGARRRVGRRSTIAATVALAETAVYLSNNQVCPLTPLAEALGADNGSVTDILLPLWFSRRIPFLSGTVLVIGLALNLRNWRERRSG